MTKSKVTTDLEKNTLTIERTIQAPIDAVWNAYSNQAKFESWWGPEGWETTTKVFDFAPDGRIHYGMKCVDENQGEWFGKESWGIMEIKTVSEPTTFSAKDYFSDESGTINTEMPGQVFTVELVEEGNSTRLINRSFVESRTQLEELIKMGMVEGFDSQLNKLEALLTQ